MLGYRNPFAMIGWKGAPPGGAALALERNPKSSSIVRVELCLTPADGGASAAAGAAAAAALAASRVRVDFITFDPSASDAAAAADADAAAATAAAAADVAAPAEE